MKCPTCTRRIESIYCLVHGVHIWWCNNCGSVLTQSDEHTINSWSVPTQAKPRSKGGDIEDAKRTLAKQPYEGHVRYRGVSLGHFTHQELQKIVEAAVDHANELAFAKSSNIM